MSGLLAFEQHLRIALLGVTLFVAIQEFWLDRSRGGDPIHRMAARWALLIAAMLLARWVRGSDPGAPQMEVIRIEYAVGLLMLPVGVLVARGAVGKPSTIDSRIGLAATFAVAATPFAGDLLLQGTLVARTDAFSNRFLAPRAGPLLPLLVPFVAAGGAYAWRLARAASPAVDPDRRRLILANALVLGGCAANDILLDLGLLRSIRLLDLGVAIALLSICRNVIARAGRVFRGLENAVRSRTGELEAALRSIRGVIDALPDAVLVYADSRILFANRAVQGRLDWEPGNLVGRSMTDLLPSDRVESGLATFVALERSVSPEASREETILRHDGRRILCDVAGLAFEFEGRRAALAILRDVTDRRQMETQLRQADRLAAVGSLAAGVAHEINNPLTYVAANVAAVKAQIESGASETDARSLGMAALLGEAAQGAERIRRIVADLRTFARPEDSAVRRVRLRAVLDLAIAMTSNEIRHRARLLLDLGDLPRVVGSEARLAQVFVNLLLNAAQAIPAGAADRHRIRVSARTGGTGDAIVEVADTGGGIPVHIRDRVFDPFFTTKPFGEGTGLGLAATHGIVQTMGGRIELGDAPEGGALVRVTLPGAPSAPDTAPPWQGAAEPRGRVLVVDDDAMVARTLKRMLRAHDVVVATSGEEALELCARGPFDVVLCDVMMPGLSGVDVLERLRAVDATWSERFVFVTGGAFSQETADALDGTGVPRVDKPVDPVRLAALIRERVLRRLPS